LSNQDFKEEPTPIDPDYEWFLACKQDVLAYARKCKIKSKSIFHLWNLAVRYDIISIGDLHLAKRYYDDSFSQSVDRHYSWYNQRT